MASFRANYAWTGGIGKILDETEGRTVLDWGDTARQRRQGSMGEII